ncbi:diacylglycerol kinase [Paenibacillus lemnae]|uniref:Diacylglycerol kinase family protein n=1 Tax=Paenibacillus lemnae TaxID=1330551 RepID=A0A848M257_PAELE|nr:diacylglycerol kinase family protein [Paenibacillus lemnae]
MKPERHDFAASFRYACHGILHALKSEVNLKIHVSAAAMVFLAAALLDVGKWEWLSLLLASALVICAELFNTAVEAVVDLVSPESHPLARIAKDTAAGAVLVTAVFAAAVGIIVFYGPVTAWFKS